MSYDVALYDARFLRRAVDEQLGDWLDADPLPPDAIELVREHLRASGYVLEFEDDDHQEWAHPNRAWGLQVSIFSREIAWVVPYWADCESAIACAVADAKELADRTGLGYYDGQTGEVIT